MRFTSVLGARSGHRTLAALVGALALVSPGLHTSATSATPAKGTPVDVLYAASLEKIMQDQIGPAFDRATGYTFVGFAGPSKELAADIKGKLKVADVFVSAAPAVNKSLMGTANGDWVSSYKAFGNTGLQIGYDPKNKFAAQLKTKPWYAVVVEPGFRLGRTDPATDPKGELAVTALEGAAARYKEPELKMLATETSDVFPETDLVGRVQLGELDAGFFYAVEAVAANIPTVPLTGFKLFATYTVAAVNRSPHPGAGARFATFLEGPTTQAILRKDGMSTSS